jgi:hypothetical protein
MNNTVFLSIVCHLLLKVLIMVVDIIRRCEKTIGIQIVVACNERLINLVLYFSISQQSRGSV